MKRTFAVHLLLRIAPTVFLIFVITAVLAFFSCRREINYVYDMQMANDADVLWTLVKEELSEKSYKKSAAIRHGKDSDTMAIWNGDADDYGSARMFRIWHNGNVVMRSDNALPDELPQQKAGFSDVTYAKIQWRIYAIHLNATTSLEVGEQEALRTALIWNILLDLLLPLLLVAPLVGMGLWAAIKQGIRPVHLLVKQIQRRSPDDLTDIDARELPRDLKPLGKSINRLFEKVSHSINVERRFADHAAHQLRTPLAGTQLLIQMLKSADSEEERAELLADLEESNHRAAELIRKLLIASRVSHQAVNLQPVTVYPMVAAIIGDLDWLVQQKGLNLSLVGDEAIQVMADETLFALMVANVIDNAVKYSYEKGSIEVSIARHAEGCRLTVTDNGPGISKSERLLVFERFYRADTAVGEGTGLGLTMAADIVHRFDGTITLDEVQGTSGLQLSIDLPAI